MPIFPLAKATNIEGRIGLSPSREARRYIIILHPQRELKVLSSARARNLAREAHGTNDLMQAMSLCEKSCHFPAQGEETSYREEKEAKRPRKRRFTQNAFKRLISRFNKIFVGFAGVLITRTSLLSWLSLAIKWMFHGTFCGMCLFVRFFGTYFGSLHPNNDRFST